MIVLQTVAMKVMNRPLVVIGLCKGFPDITQIFTKQMKKQLNVQLKASSNKLE